VNNSGIRRNQRASGEIKGHPAKSKGIRRNQRASGEIKGHPAKSKGIRQDQSWSVCEGIRNYRLIPEQSDGQFLRNF